METLKGKKTYIVAGLAAVAVFIKYLGYIDEDTFQMFMGLLGAGSIATLAAKTNRIDKKLVLFIFLATIPSILQAQTPTYLAWDYLDTEIINVTNFQTRVDTGPYVDAGLPTGEVLADTPTGNHTYKWLLPAFQTGGNHTVSVRACNATECSFEPSLVFKLIGPPTNLRIKK